MCWEADVGRTHLAFVVAGSRKASRGDDASRNEAATPLVRVNGGAKVKRCEEAKSAINSDGATAEASWAA
jgi:hypothetical protein